jgi:hypothetical protein
MYSFIYDEDLFERVNCYLMDKKDSLFDLEHTCWFLQVSTKRPLNRYAKKVK